MQSTEVSPNSILRLILGVAGVVVILAGMRVASTIVNMVLMAALLTMVFVPLYMWLQHRGLKNWLALITVFLVVALIGIGLLGLFGITVAGLVGNVATYQQELEQETAQLQQALQARGVDASTYTSALESAGKQLLSVVAGVASNVAGMLVNWVFVLLIFGYMLAESDGFVRRIRVAVNPDSTAYARTASAVPSVIKFLAIITVLNLIIAALDTIYLWFLGIPNALLWGVVAFVCGFIPYIGYWISVLPPMILGFAQGGISTAIIVLLGYWFINGILSSVVAPRYFGKGMNVSPVLTLVAVLFWGWLLGPVGAVIGVPLTVLLKSIVLENYASTRWLADVLSQEIDDDGPESPVQSSQV